MKALDKELIDSCKKRNVEQTKRLIKKGADVNAVDEDGWTPLRWASVKGFKELVELLIYKGADVNAVNRYGGTALMGASYNGRLEIAKLLIESGADVNPVNKSGFTALMCASCKGHTQTAKLLTEAGAGAHGVDKYSEIAYKAWVKLVSWRVREFRKIDENLIHLPIYMKEE